MCFHQPMNHHDFEFKGPCSSRAWRWNCHDTLYATLGPLKSQIPSIKNKPHKRHWKTYMAVFDGTSPIPGLARTLSWFDTQHCRKCLQLGPLFSIVSLFFLVVLPLLLMLFSYNMLKKRASDGDLYKTLSAPQYLICSAEASSHFVFRLVHME
jgi:hypothetical protein